MKPLQVEIELKKKLTVVEINSKTEEWFSAGARIFGGCCRTYPEDIKNVRKALESICRK
jgi:S-methylmethionine-dependent homocysteine/selenocysteine methylase